MTRREFDEQSWPEIVRTIITEARALADGDGAQGVIAYLNDVERILDDAAEDAVNTGR